MTIDRDALRAEVATEVERYQRVFPPPYRLSANLELALRAVRALEEAEAAVARVRDLHRDDGTGDCTECCGINGMGEFWPCPTILALNGEE